MLPVQSRQLRWLVFPSSRVVYREGMGDLLAYQSEIVTPPQDPYRILAEYPLAWDADGFRVPARPTEGHYDVVVIGDSFAEGASVARPFPDGLAEQTGLFVRNLGVRGIGPTEQALLMEQVAADNPASVVVLQFFGGNDFSDADSYTWRQDFRLPATYRSQEGETPRGTRLWRYPYADEAPQASYKYPVRATAATAEQPISFLEGYLWAYNTTAPEIAQSYALAETQRAWQVVDDLTGAACLMVLYIPSKEEIYLPLVVPEDRDRLFDSAYRLTVSTSGDIFRLEPDPDLTFDALVARLLQIGDAVGAAAREAGYVFVDARPAFAEAAARGERLYYEYDTHVNQIGQDLIATVLAEALGGCVP